MSSRGDKHYDKVSFAISDALAHAAHRLNARVDFPKAVAQLTMPAHCQSDRTGVPRSMTDSRPSRVSFTT
jgi:hypothetical protein